MSRKETTLHKAHRIAEEHGLFYVPVTEGIRRAWVVYRRNPHGPHWRIGRCSTAGKLLNLVKHAAGVADESPKQPAPAKEESAF